MSSPPMLPPAPVRPRKRQLEESDVQEQAEAQISPISPANMENCMRRDNVCPVTTANESKNTGEAKKKPHSLSMILSDATDDAKESQHEHDPPPQKQRQQRITSFFERHSKESERISMHKSRRIGAEEAVHSRKRPLPVFATTSTVETSATMLSKSNVLPPPPPPLARPSPSSSSPASLTTSVLVPPPSVSMSSVASSTNVSIDFSATRLDSRTSNTAAESALESKENVVRPVPKRNVYALNSPPITPSLPTLHSPLPALPPLNAMSSAQSSPSKNSPLTIPQASNPHEVWKPPQLSSLKPPVAAGMTPRMNMNATGAQDLLFEPCEDDTHDYSTDEELCRDPTETQGGEHSMVAAIVSSQEMIENLSVSSRDPNPVSLKLTEQFLQKLSEQQRMALKSSGLWRITLSSQGPPITMGREAFRSVFGDQIHGVPTVTLSRRHCVLHIHGDDTRPADVSVEIENTSTNGIEVNYQLLAHGQKRRLVPGDIVTLLRFPTTAESNDPQGLDYVYHNPPAAHEARRNPPVPNASESNPSTEDTVEVTTDDETSPKKPMLPSAGSESPDQDNSASSSRYSPPVESAANSPARFSILIASPLSMDGRKNSLFGQHNYFKQDMMSLLSTWLSNGVVQVNYGIATEASFATAIKSGDADVLVYAGDGGHDYIVLEDANGNPCQLAARSLTDMLTEGAQHWRSRLLIVLTRRPETANLMMASGATHVVFVDSETPSRVRSLCFLRSFIAGLLSGKSIAASFKLGKAIALYDLIPCAHSKLQESFQLFSSSASEPQLTAVAKSTTSLLSGQFIPLSPERFIGREEQVKQIIRSLRSQSVQVCSLFGQEGSGKSAIAIRVATYANERGWYPNGVHFIPIKHICHEFFASTDENHDQQNNTMDQPLVTLSKHLNELLCARPATKSTDQSQLSLVVLDGCDSLALRPLTTFLTKLLESFPATQILLTSRAEMKITNLPTEVVPIRSLSAAHATELLLATMAHPPERIQLQKSLVKWQTDALDHVIAQHPALMNCHGLPSLLIRLAMELDEPNLTMDALV